jgi:hypothetical protein
MTIQTKKLMSAIGSGVVILCFFLPWVRYMNMSGLTYFTNSFRTFELSKYDSTVVLWVLVGWAVMLTPLVCHIISLIRTLSRNVVSKPLALIPACLWALALIFGSARYFDIESGFAGIGVIGTFLGIAFTTVVAFLKAGPAPARMPYQYAAGPQVASAFCPQCGRPLVPGALFCPGCGAQARQAPAEPVCACGARYKPGAVFCTSCGRRLGQ